MGEIVPDHFKNSNRGPCEIRRTSPGTCTDCDGNRVLYTGNFMGGPNRAVTCPGCKGTGKA